MKKDKPKNSINIRVYELAKRYGLSSKAFIEELHEYGVSVKNHMSSLDPETVELIEAERNAKKTRLESHSDPAPAAIEEAIAQTTAAEKKSQRFRKFKRESQSVRLPQLWDLRIQK